MKRNNRFLTLLALLLVTAGGLLLGYPMLMQRVYRIHVEEMKTEFETLIEEEPDTPQPVSDAFPYEELYRELVRRNQELYEEKQEELYDPFSYEQPDISLEEYGLEGNVIGFLEIPRMEIELPIFLGANAENMKRGAVHLTQTSYPVGGENTNAVIAAHRGYSKAAMFRHIERLEEGDLIYIHNFRETLTYQVSERKVILPTEVEELLIQEGRDLVTLLTCHPYRHNYQRYVVYCRRVYE